MSTKKTKRVTIKLTSKDYKEFEKYVGQSDHKNRTEFVEAAIKHYGGYVRSKEENLYIPIAISSVMESIASHTEDRICRILFKWGVELSMLMHTLAATVEIEDEVLRKLRKKCISDLKKTVGSVNLQEIAEYQNRSI